MAEEIPLNHKKGFVCITFPCWIQV